MLKEYIQGVRSLSIIGMCKNAGKTTVLNKLIAELNGSRVRLGLTSIGRDGESTDLVTRTAKPGIYVYEGTLVATAVDMFRLSDITREIIYFHIYHRSLRLVLAAEHILYFVHYHLLYGFAAGL